MTSFSLPARQPTPSSEVARAERLLHLTRALASLPESQRQVIGSGAG